MKALAINVTCGSCGKEEKFEMDFAPADEMNRHFLAALETRGWRREGQDMFCDNCKPAA